MRRHRAAALAGLGLLIASTTACSTSLDRTTTPDKVIGGQGYYRVATPVVVPTAPALTIFPESSASPETFADFGG